MRTVILNTDSILNPGDAGIVLAQIGALRTLFPGLDISLTSRTPLLDGPFFKPLGVSVLPPLIPAPSLVRGFGPKIVRGLREIAGIGAKTQLVRAIRSADFTVACGGGSLYSNRRFFPGPTFFQNAVHIRLAQALKKPVVFLPQSFGPFSSPAARRTVKHLLDHPGTAKIFVRETSSMDRLRRLGSPGIRAKADLCPDMAFRLEPGKDISVDPRIEALPRPRLAMTVRDWDFPEASNAAQRKTLRDGYLRAFAAAARRFTAESGGSVLLVPHTRGPGDFEDDRIVSRHLWARWAGDIRPERRLFLDLPDDAAPSALMEIYARADVVLATRTHSAVFALLAGTPAVSVHYQPKGRGLMALLGLAGRSLPITGLSEPALTEALDDALSAPPEERRRIGERIADLRGEIDARLRAGFEEIGFPVKGRA